MLLSFCLFSARATKFNFSFATYLDTLTQSLGMMDKGPLRHCDVVVYVDASVPAKALARLLAARARGHVSITMPGQSVIDT